ncbi:MAG: hypothetical protein AAF961_11995 [Planctomycetota bacterium]
MSGPAQVRSTHAIEEFREALARFERRIQTALDGLDAQMRRAQDWVDHDRPSHWRRETRKAEDGVHQAKVDLNRCLMFPVAGERPSCREERATLKLAEKRLDYCRDKSESVRRWQRDLQHEVLEYQGRIGQLKRVLELDLPRARGALDAILGQIARYRQERPVGGTRAAGPNERTDRQPPLAERPAATDELNANSPLE